MNTKVHVVERVCQAFQKGRPEHASRLMDAGYRWEAQGEFDGLPVPRLPKPLRYPKEEPSSPRRFDDAAYLRIWTLDGFLDRYSGERLVFPGTLILLATLLRNIFPLGRRNGDRRITHQAMSELWPAVDHVIPITRPCELRAHRIHDPNSDDNLATTSIENNRRKGRYLPAEIGWTLRPRRASDDWDGLTGWFREYLALNPAPFKDARHGEAIRTWKRLLG